MVQRIDTIFNPTVDRFSIDTGGMNGEGNAETRRIAVGKPQSVTEFLDLGTPAPMLTAPPVAEIEAGLRRFIPPGQTTEFRAGGVINGDPKFPATWGGFWGSDHLGPMAQVASLQTEKAESVWFLFNPLDPELLNIRANRVAKYGKGDGASDRDVLRRTRLVIDFDPVRRSVTTGKELTGKVSATEAEKAKAFACLTLAVRFLVDEMGWPEPSEICDSGNGFHVWWRIELATEDGKLVERILKGLHARFTNEDVKVDSTCFNPSRPIKLYGTKARKGEDGPERPHRYSGILWMSERPVVVDRERMEATADRLAPEAAQQVQNATASPAKSKRPSRWTEPANEAMGGSGDKVIRARKYLDKFQPAISGQNGSDQTFDAACALVIDFDMPPHEAKPILAEWNKRCVPPWEDHELDHKLADADKKTGPRGRLLHAERAAEGDAEPAKKEQKKKREVPANAFMNADPEDGDAPIDLASIKLNLHMIAKTPQPYRVGNRLFVDPIRGHDPIWLDRSSSLFAWVLSHSEGLHWVKGEDYITQEMFFEHLKQKAFERKTIEKYPHFPEIDGHHYIHPALPKPSGKLDELISFFNPATPADRELIKAFILTMFWGGPCGSRPAFLVTGPDVDEKGGIGVGKSKLTEIVSDLAGGSIEISGKDDFNEVKTRALTPSARHKRMLRVDNLKSHKFSWGELEGQITAKEVSGRMLYQGDGSRPNTLTLALTLNGASLSRDMADRVIVIKLDRSVYRASWDADLAALIERHQWAIIAEIGEILGRDVEPIDAKTRFATWEQGVLARTDMLAECQSLILERQGNVNEDDNEKTLVADHFSKMLRHHGHNPETECITIPPVTVAEWISDITRKHHSTNHASAHLAGLNIPEMTRVKKPARGWVWRGKAAQLRARPVDLGESFSTPAF